MNHNDAPARKRCVRDANSSRIFASHIAVASCDNVRRGQAEHWSYPHFHIDDETAVGSVVSKLSACTQLPKCCTAEELLVSKSHTLRQSWQVRSEIESGLVNLRRKTKRKDEESWEIVVKSAINCLLCLPSTKVLELLNRKYSLVEIDPVTNTCSIVALFPLVAERIRRFILG